MLSDGVGTWCQWRSCRTGPDRLRHSWCSQFLREGLTLGIEIEPNTVGVHHPSLNVNQAASFSPKGPVEAGLSANQAI